MSVSTEQVAAFIQEHGDFKPYGIPANELIFHGAEALNKFSYWHWLKKFVPNKGFILTTHKYANILAAELDADGHSGGSFACTMRFLQRIAFKYIEYSPDGPDQCPICFTSDDENDKIILECSHLFHSKCIEEWYSHTEDTGKTLCPVCRGDTVNNYAHINRVQAVQAYTRPQQTSAVLVESESGTVGVFEYGGAVVEYGGAV